MKKIVASTLILILSINHFHAQIEMNLKLGNSNYSDNSGFGSFPSSPVFYTQLSCGYRFFNDDHITLIPKLYFEKSGFIMEDLTMFGGYDNNGFLTLETSDINYKLYSTGIETSAEIKFLNLEKKANIYIAPNIGYRRVLYSKGSPSNPYFGESYGSNNIQQSFIIDWGVEIGVKIKKIKIALSLRDVVNKGNRDNSAFVINSAFGVNVAYLFGAKGSKKEVIEEE